MTDTVGIFNEEVRLLPLKKFLWIIVIMPLTY